MATRTVAIVGRPNVGKSALFNRLAGRKISIVHDQPGVTRDRLAAECKLGRNPFTIVDTGGIGSVVDASFSEQVRTEADIAIATADVLLFVVDGQSGLTPVDQELAQVLRRADKPLVLLVNKIDDPKHTSFADEFTRLGFKNVLSISAEHGLGIGHLVELAESFLPTKSANEKSAPASLSIAIVGRPNVGKSSLINAILDDRRTMVSDISGTTRDAVDVPYTRGEQQYVLIDTAGIRARGKVDNSVEVFSVMRAERSIRRADLCVLVIDAVLGVTSQDKKIAGSIQKAEKPCIVVVNKWDLVTIEGERKEFLHEFMDDIRAELFFVDYAPLLMLSAKTGENMERLFRIVEQVRESSRGKISTGVLNRMLQSILTATPPPIRSGRRFKILYATQVEASAGQAIPVPRFLLFVNDPKALPDSYRKHIDAQLREKVRFMGLPIILMFRGRPPREKQKS
ncbi:MAG: GTPase [Chthoniobacter sp.]|jgi:GTP-binding protein|nr:GTPase [Chthoniobacter sp.]